MARILVIEDEAPVQMLLTELLSRRKYDVQSVNNGEDGLKKLKDEHFDLVITDIFMPLKDGLEVIKELHKYYPHVKIIAISGGGRYGIKYLDLAVFLGAHVSIAKPFETSDILDSVERLLGTEDSKEQ